MDAEPDGELLAGGNISRVVRIGDTVARTPGPQAGFVRELLTLLESAGWAGAPRHLGTDRRGRELLGFVPGRVPWRDPVPASVRTAAALGAVAHLVRQLHDLTAGSVLAGDREVVCHNDLAPRNTVYRDAGEGLRPVVFIDWDAAAPGDRIEDVAHACWQFVPLMPGTRPERAARLLRVIADRYERDTPLLDRSALLDTVRWWQDRTWRGIDAGAAAGDPAMIGLRERGVVARTRAAYRWTTEHRRLLGAHLPRRQQPG